MLPLSNTRKYTRVATQFLYAVNVWYRIVSNENAVYNSYSSFTGTHKKYSFYCTLYVVEILLCKWSFEVLSNMFSIDYRVHNIYQFTETHTIQTRQFTETRKRIRLQDLLRSKTAGSVFSTMLCIFKIIEFLVHNTVCLYIL